MTTNTSQIDPSFWSDQLFEDGPDEMDLTPETRNTIDDTNIPQSQMIHAGDSQSVITHNWRGGERTSPQHSPNASHVPLPLEEESPAIRIQEDFGTSPGTNPGLHHLLPSLGVSQGSPRDSLFGRNQPGNIPANRQSTETASSLSFRPPATMPTQENLNNLGSSNRNDDNSAPYFYTGVPGNPSGVPNAALAMSPRAMLLAGTANTMINEQNKTPLQPSSNRSHEPSPLGRYYLSSSDPQHISKRPQGSISFPSVSASTTPTAPVIPGFNTSPALRNRGEKESPTLSMASDEALMLGDDPNPDGKDQRLFPGLPSSAGNRRIGHSRLGSGGTSVQPHQIPLPPSPHISGPSNSPASAVKGSPGVRAIALGFGGTGGQLGSGRVPPSPSQLGDRGESSSKSRPRLRQETTDSFASTSSEEEDISSPMVLPDTSLRASDRGTNSPRSAFSGNLETGITSDKGPKGLFPAWSDVQRFDKMANNPFAFGASSTSYPTMPITNAKFTFRAGTDAPTFPPMSPSSSSSLDSDDDANTRGPGTVRFSGPVSPKRSQTRNDSAAEDGGDYGHGYGGGKGYTASEGRDGHRSGSIIVGGKGYGDGSSAANMNAPDRHGDEDSSDEDDRPRQKRVDKKLEAPAYRLLRAIRADERGPARGADGSLKDDEEGPSRPMEAASEDEDNRTNTTLQDTTDSEAESGSDYEGQSSNSRQRPRKRKALRVEATSVGADSKSETSSNSRPDFMPSKAKRRKAGPAEEGDVHCDYVEPLPPYERCTSHFHRTYDLARHLETIHARNEGRAVEAGQLDEKAAKLWVEYGRPQCSWPCPVPSCGQIFSRKDAMQRHLKTKRHEGAVVPAEYLN